MKRIILFLLLSHLTVTLFYGQSLAQMEKERKKTEEAIALTNKMIAKNSKSKNQELSNLKLLSQKINYRQKLIADIKNESNKLSNLIREKELVIESYGDDLKKMKDAYAELLQYLWSRRSTHQQLMYVLAGEDIRQIYRRFRYMNEFAKHQKTQATAIQELSFRLIAERDSLNIQKQQRKALLSQYNNETTKLQGEQDTKKEQIETLKKKETQLKKQLAKQQKKRAELQRFVDKLIAAEAKKAGTGEKMKLTPEQRLTSNQFVGNKGRLPWPVASGVINEPYGKHKHEVFSRVEVKNDGVDIRTESDAQARSVFSGEVTLIVALPGYNKGVIVQHGAYYTFYANLSEVSVKKGDKVSTKQKLGTVYTDNAGEAIIHFQVWKGTVKQNPQLWLSK